MSPSREAGFPGGKTALWMALLLAVYLVLAVSSLWSKSVTVDEYAHLPAGCAALRHGTLDLYGKTPPLVRYVLAAPALGLSAVVPVPDLPTRGGGWDPWVYGDAFVHANAGPLGLGRYERLVRAARLAGVALGAALLLLVFAWGRSLHGDAAGLLAAFLLALSPTFLAHARLATVDVGAALAVTAALWLAVRAIERGGVGPWSAAGAAVGLALASKFTAFLLLPVLLVAAALARWRGLGERGVGWRRGCVAALAGLASLWAVLVLAYQLSDLGRPVRDYAFESRAARVSARLLPGWAPVPLPGAMLRGMDGQLLDLEDAEMPNYLNGRWSRRGWWYYYPEALLLKTPLAAWALLLLALTAWLRRRGRAAPTVAPERRRLTTLVLSLWAGGLFASSLLSHLDIGIRYLLPAYPAAILLVAGALAPLLSGARRGRVALGLLGLAYAGSALSVHPDYLPFFNLLAGGPGGGWRYLANSNNDWGQDLPRLRRWLQAEAVKGPIHLAYFGHLDPARYGIDYRLPPDHPEAGVHVVSLNLLLGMPYVVNDHGRWVLIGRDLVTQQHEYAWLRSRQPDARLGESLWVFRVGRDTRPSPAAPEAPPS